EGCSMAVLYSFFSPPSSLTIFLARLTVVLGAGASAFFAGFLSPSALAASFTLAGGRLAPILGAGFLARFGSAGASGWTAGAALAGSAACASPLGITSPL